MIHVNDHALRTRAELLDWLRDKIAATQGRRLAAPAGILPTGIAPLDAALPAGGLPAGSLTEWIGAVAGGGVQTAALAAAAGICRDGRRIIVVDPAGTLYPPALAGIVPLDNVVLVRPGGARGAAWALEQCLRCPAAPAVIALVDRLDERTAQRLRRAVEIGGGSGFLIRAGDARPEIRAAAVRLRVEARPSAGGVRRLIVEIEKARGLREPIAVGLEVDLASGRVSASAEPSRPAAPVRTARASG